MAGNTGTLAGSVLSQSGKPERARSTIEFPYNALDDAELIAKGVRDVGATECDWDQLAAHLNFAAQGGGFRVRMLGAKVFNLVTYDRGRVALTDTGIRIVDPQFARAARVESFLSVALYKQAYEKLKGQTLPPIAAIERLLESLGVAPKQKDKARQAFIRSARYAGFMDIKPDRLSMPPNINSPETGDEEKSADKAPQKERGGGNGGGSGGGSSTDEQLHPFIRGLLNKLPEPESNWSGVDRIKWLQTAASIFDLIYVGPDGEPVVIEVKVKKESP